MDIFLNRLSIDPKLYGNEFEFNRLTKEQVYQSI